MPGFLTHYIAGRALLKGLDPHIQRKIDADERLYNLGNQGPDIFFYYFPGQLRKRSRGVGSRMHEANLGVFLALMARLAKGESQRKKDTIFAYTSGFLMHYALDSHAHPYVYAMTYNDDATKIKNSAEHRKFETAIDVAMLKLAGGKRPAEVKQWELINAEKKQMQTAAAAISRGVSEVYHRDVPAKVVHRAMRHMVHFTRLLESKTGRRKRWVGLIENMTIGEPLFSSMVHMQELTDDLDYLNIKKSPWRAPWEEGDDSTFSFVECYHNAVDEAILLVNGLYAYVYENLPPEILAEKIGNRSLKTGKPCDTSL